MQRGARIGIALLLTAVLALVFLSYLNPHLAVDLANRVWACSLTPRPGSDAGPRWSAPAGACST